MLARLDYAESCAKLRDLGFVDDDAILQLPDDVPQHDDEEPLGVSFFRTLVENVDLSNLTLPRTFASRSSFERVLFENSDLSQSNFCWNDFSDCSFVDANLSRSDLRAVNFVWVLFDRADLTGADLRRSSFEGCRFTGADMSGTILTRRQGAAISLSLGQQAAIAWTNEDGPEPAGG